MITAKIDLPSYEPGITYRQNFVWASVLPIYELSIEGLNIKVVTKTPHNLLSGALVAIQEVVPGFYNMRETVITVLDSHSFTVVPELPLPEYVSAFPSFSEISCQVPINLSGCGARFTVYNSLKEVVTVITESTGITLGAASGTITIYISDEDTSLLATPVLDEKFTYTLEILHPSGEVSRPASGKLQQCNFKKKVFKDIYFIDEKITYLVVTAPQGVPGVNGISAINVESIEEFIAASVGPFTLSLPGGSGVSGIKVYINGLLQPENSFTVTGITLTLPVDLEIQPDDVVTVYYFSTI